MTEQYLRHKAKEYCDRKGWKCWFAPRVRYKAEQDIFGAFDMVYMTDTSYPQFVQITTLDHAGGRYIKITGKGINFGWIWAYNKNIKEFDIFKINDYG